MTSADAPDPLPASKAALRATLRARRAALTPVEHAAASAQLADRMLALYDQITSAPQARPHRAIASVLSFGTEPDTAPLLTGFHDRGVTIYVPISARDGSMSWARWTPDTPLGPSLMRGLKEPTPEASPRLDSEILTRTDLIHIPALAATAAGYRIGYGGGYYDRMLAELYRRPVRPITVAPVFAHEFFPDPDTSPIPVEPHDAPVDVVITPEATHPVTGRL